MIESPGVTTAPSAAPAETSTRKPRRTSSVRRTRSAAAAERRTVRKIRFTAAEWAVVEERARACGRAPARYVREVALGAVPKVSRTRANAPIIRELGALAVALQRVGRAVREPGESGASGGERDTGVERSVASSSATGDIDAVIIGLLAIVRRLG
jgi:hypothetical protein